MPSPFPGMDPWLEGPLWTSFHAQLASEIARQLAPRLLPKYVALTTEWFVLEDPSSIAIQTYRYPDVAVRTTGAASEYESAAAVVAAPVRMATVMPEKVPHFSIEIRDTKERELVTAIEILSPTNKRGRGREKYLEKREQLHFNYVHLVEIDLLRTGQRLPMQQPLPPADYYVLVGRAEQSPIMNVWPIGLRDLLPKIGIPLRDDDPDVPLDLQLALTTIYDLLGYRYATDYSVPPETPLSPENRQWAEVRLIAAGIHPTA